ncbi:MAG: radical SAM protein [Myxococcota bacterium]
MHAFAPHEITHLRERLRETWDRLTPDYQQRNQVLGAKRTIGCVALEVTQRCNLDCSICYLSENSESTPDIPLDTIFRRIDRIRQDYGVGTNVQITGGDPTLRDHDELERIVRHCVDNKLMPSLFTNGIYATRELLQRLAEAGLMDVAFHVDLTEKRKGFSREEQLLEVRQEYIERARGLGLTVIFNQTVFARNYDEVPLLVDFYKRNSDVVGMASFQLQADTGRGLTRKRKQTISIDTVSKQIEQGLGTSLSWDNVLFGHPSCHKIGYALIIDPKGQAKPVDMFDDRDALVEMLHVFDDVYFDRRKMGRAVFQAIEAAAKRKYLKKGVEYWGRRLSENLGDMVKAKGQVRKISFFMQNFQDAQNIDHERIDNCSFHCMTEDGGVSMCVHNAYRDYYLQGGTGYPPHYRQLRKKQGYKPDGAGIEQPAAAK